MANLGKAWAQEASQSGSTTTTGSQSALGEGLAANPNRTAPASPSAQAALAETGQDVCADIKDDDTLSAQLDSMPEARKLLGFDSLTVSGAGPARCETLLLQVQDWVSKGAIGYRLCKLDLGDDAWYALMVREAFAAEFDVLGMSLALPG
jgi:hypothetical protein